MCGLRQRERLEDREAQESILAFPTRESVWRRAELLGAIKPLKHRHCDRSARAARFSEKEIRSIPAEKSSEGESPRVSAGEKYCQG